MVGLHRGQHGLQVEVVGRPLEFVSAWVAACGPGPRGHTLVEVVVVRDVVTEVDQDPLSTVTPADGTVGVGLIEGARVVLGTVLSIPKRHRIDRRLRHRGVAVQAGAIQHQARKETDVAIHLASFAGHVR